jgi:hypothetical protein
MTPTGKSLYIGALILAGILSLFLCFFGLMGLGWSGFGRGMDSASIFWFFLPFLMAFPLFVFSLGGTRLAYLGLWVLAPYHRFWLVHISSQNSPHSFRGFLQLLALCACQRQLLGLIVLAASVQFGI